MNRAYLAGFFDGDGCVGIYKYKSKSARRGFKFQLIVSISQKNRFILDEIQKIYGGGISKNNISNVYSWRSVGRSSKLFLEDIVKFLILKRQETKFAIQFINIFCTKYGHHKLTNSESELQKLYYNRLKKIKFLKLNNLHDFGDKLPK